VKAVTDLTHALGLAVTAEGIESTVQRDEIIHLGCDSSQGYCYAKPMPSSVLGKQLGAGHAHPLYLPKQRSVVSRGVSSK
jgi:EAL domain-containing protein (putative c-di-GMP-specific phosphodiesterase class I)